MTYSVRLKTRRKNLSKDKLLSIDWSIFWQYIEKHNVSSYSYSSVLFLYVYMEATLIGRTSEWTIFFFFSSLSLSLIHSFSASKQVNAHTNIYIERRRRRRRTCSSSSSFFYYSYYWLLVDFNKIIAVSTQFLLYHLMSTFFVFRWLKPLWSITTNIYDYDVV